MLRFFIYNNLRMSWIQNISVSRSIQGKVATRYHVTTIAIYCAGLVLPDDCFTFLYVALFKPYVFPTCALNGSKELFYTLKGIIVEL